MNTQLCKWLISIPLCLCLGLSASSALAKKPKPPPDPVIDGAACADSVSFFPAFVYSVDNELFLSNADGDCAIPVYKSPTDWIIGGNPDKLSYRWYGDADAGIGKVVWEEDYVGRKNRISDKFQLLSFTVVDGAIVDALPISPDLLLDVGDGAPAGLVASPELSPMGDRVVFTGVGLVGGLLYFFMDEMEIHCAPLCRDRVFESWQDANGDGFKPNSPHYSLEKERIYFELIDHPIRRLVFIDKDINGAWSTEPTLIMDDHEDGRYGPGSVGYWDHDGDGYAQEVIAHEREFIDGYETIEILDVEACVAGSPDCVLTRDDEEIVIEGYGPSFNSFSDGPPDLLFLREDLPGEEWTIREYDLSTGSEHPIKTINGLSGIDAAD